MKPYTHCKRAYKARCVQWCPNNTDEILALFDCASLYGDGAIMVRWQNQHDSECGITTMYIGWWVVIGEDNKTRIYNPDRFAVLYDIC